MTIAPKATRPEAADVTALALARLERARAICDAEPEASFGKRGLGGGLRLSSRPGHHTGSKTTRSGSFPSSRAK